MVTESLRHQMIFNYWNDKMWLGLLQTFPISVGLEIIKKTGFACRVVS